MKVLVTGGSGFIGTRLIRGLRERGHEVVIFDKNPSTAYPELVIPGDVRDADTLMAAMAGIDAVFHLAAEHADDVRPISLYADVNVGGARNLVAAAQEQGVKKIIFTSSVAIYGLDAGEPDEESPVRPFNPYGQSKYDSEVVFNRWVDSDSVNSLVIIRPCVIFGEANRGNVYNLLRQIYSGRFIMIGKGKNKKSMGYVGNIASFLTSILDLPSGTHTYNYADKPDLATSELVSIARQGFGMPAKANFYIPYFAGLAIGYALDAVSNVSGKRFPISSIRIKKFCADTVVNADRLEASGFKRPFSLEEALLTTIEAERFESQ